MFQFGWRELYKNANRIIHELSQFQIEFVFLWLQFELPTDLKI